MHEHIKKLRFFLKDFLTRAKRQGEYSSEAWNILIRYTKGESITKDDVKKLRTQIIDLIKILGIGIPYILIPGSTLLLALLVSISKKYKIKILPSSFKDM